MPKQATTHDRENITTTIASVAPYMTNPNSIASDTLIDTLLPYSVTNNIENVIDIEGIECRIGHIVQSEDGNSKDVYVKNELIVTNLRISQIPLTVIDSDTDDSNTKSSPIRNIATDLTEPVYYSIDATTNTETLPDTE